MKTLLKELDRILEEKNKTIATLEWWKQYLEGENEKLKAENETLKLDVAMYQENESKGDIIDG